MTLFELRSYAQILCLFIKEFKIDFQNRKWSYPNRKCNYFSHFQTSDKKIFYKMLQIFMKVSWGLDGPSSAQTGTGTEFYYRVIEIKFELHTRALIQAVSWEKCTFSNEILTFLNCTSKNSKKFHVCFKFGGNFDAQILKMCKMQ